MQADGDTKRDDGPQAANGKRSGTSAISAARSMGYRALLPIARKDRQAEDCIEIS